MNISNNVSSMQAHQTMMNVNANNVANVNSDGFIPKDARASGSLNSVSANIRSADENWSKKSQTDLSKEIPEQITISNATVANVSAIKTQDEMLGSLLDIKA